MRVQARIVAAVLLLAALTASLSVAAGTDSAGGAAFKVIVATLAIGILPGALLTLVWRPRADLTVLEIAGFGIAFSFGIVQMLTILAVALHLSPAAILAIGAAGCVALAVAAMRGNYRPLTTSVDELIVVVALLFLAVPLYLQGSPFSVYEDQVLAAIVRRLAALDAPRLDNIYVAPNMVYTYPFPGALYLMALIARLGDIDPLFVYHKLRFFWGPAALIMLYLGARSVFGSAAVACAVALAAAVFVCTGVFAMLPEFPAWWGQLAPYSYVPDVAMTVVLPALLVMSFEYLQARTPRERQFFLTGAMVLILMLTVIHIREIVQFAAYLGCFLAAAVLLKALRPYLRPTAVLLGLTLVVAGLYTVWQGSVVPVATDIVSEERRNLVALTARLSPRSLLLSPASETLGDFIQDFDQMFAGLMPFFLFGGALVISVFRDRPLVWLMSSSTIAYLAVVTVPLLAIPYIYLTYFEILHIPVRNVIWFVYLSSGALLYLAAVAIGRLDRTRLSLVAVGAFGGMLALLASLTLNRSAVGFFVPLIAAYGLAFVGTRYRRVIVAAAALLALVALWPERGAVERSDQVTVRWTTGLADDRRVALEQSFSLRQPERKADAAADQNIWNYRLSDLSVDNVRRIVTHPNVVDTHFIDRSTFQVEAQPPPGDHQPFGVIYATWLQYPSLVLAAMTAVGIWLLAFVAPAMVAPHAHHALSDSLRAPFWRHGVSFALLLIPFAAWSARPTLSPLSLAPMPPAGRAATPRAMFEQIQCVTVPAMPARFAEEQAEVPAHTSCPPDYATIEWVRQNVPVEAVFAVDRWTPFPPQLFMAQQGVVFPTLDASFIHEDSLFRDYYRLFADRMRQHRLQPFFNVAETPEQRSEFVRLLGVTHILVGPGHYDELRPVLDNLPNQYARRYDSGRWAVYQVQAD